MSARGDTTDTTDTTDTMDTTDTTDTTFQVAVEHREWALPI
jgi:hypothetical protein